MARAAAPGSGGQDDDEDAQQQQRDDQDAGQDTRQAARSWEREREAREQRPPRQDADRNGGGNGVPGDVEEQVADRNGRPPQDTDRQTGNGDAGPSPGTNGTEASPAPDRGGAARPGMDRGVDPSAATGGGDRETGGPAPGTPGEGGAAGAPSDTGADGRPETVAPSERDFGADETVTGVEDTGTGSDQTMTVTFDDGGEFTGTTGEAAERVEERVLDANPGLDSDDVAITFEDGEFGVRLSEQAQRERVREQTLDRYTMLDEDDIYVASSGDVRLTASGREAFAEERVQRGVAEMQLRAERGDFTDIPEGQRAAAEGLADTDRDLAVMDASERAQEVREDNPNRLAAVEDVQQADARGDFTTVADRTELQQISNYQEEAVDETGRAPVSLRPGPGESGIPMEGYEEGVSTQEFTVRVPEGVPFFGGEEVGTIEGDVGGPGRGVQEGENPTFGTTTVQFPEAPAGVRRTLGAIPESIRPAAADILLATEGRTAEAAAEDFAEEGAAASAVVGEVTGDIAGTLDPMLAEGARTVDVPVAVELAPGAGIARDVETLLESESVQTDVGLRRVEGGEVEGPVETTVEEAVTAGGTLATSIPLIGKEAAEYGVAGGVSLIEGDLDEFAGETASAAGGRAALGLSAMADEPGAFTARALGTAGLTAGAIGGAARLAGPRAARTTSAVIQPGEEAALTVGRGAVRAGRRGVSATRGSGSRLATDIQTTISEVADRARIREFRADERGQLDTAGRTRRRSDDDREGVDSDLGVPTDDPFRISDTRLYDPAREFGDPQDVARMTDEPRGSYERGQDIGEGVAGRGDPQPAPGVDLPEGGFSERGFATTPTTPARTLPDSALAASGGLLAGGVTASQQQQRQPQQERRRGEDTVLLGGEGDADLVAASGDLYDVGSQLEDVLTRQLFAYPEMERGGVRPATPSVVDPAAAGTGEFPSPGLDTQLTPGLTGMAGALDDAAVLASVSDAAGQQLLSGADVSADQMPGQTTDLRAGADTRADVRADARAEARAETRPRLDARADSQARVRADLRVDLRVDPMREIRSRLRQRNELRRRNRLRTEPGADSERPSPTPTATDDSTYDVPFMNPIATPGQVLGFNLGGGGRGLGGINGDADSIGVNGEFGGDGMGLDVEGIRDNYDSGGLF